MNILFVGDIVGAYGRRVLNNIIFQVKNEYAVDFTIVNGENSAHGYSITEKIYNFFIDLGIDAITMGNHVWGRKEIIPHLSKFERMIRPANYPPGVPGKDHLIIDHQGTKIAILNLLGRVFMQCMDCPFQTADKLVARLQEKSKIIIVDMHAEATSEKCAMAYYLDGRVSAVIGTHTHVMTADERILPNGTAFITDIGMVGARDSVIGMKKEQILKKFVTQMPEKFEPADSGPGRFNAVLLKIDPTSGKAEEIKRITKIIEEP